MLIKEKLLDSLVCVGEWEKEPQLVVEVPKYMGLEGLGETKT